MFAFAIWDNLERRLFLARDRMGVKPLYYSWWDGRFVFASRPSAMPGLLRAAAPEIDPQSLRIYLELGYIPAPLVVLPQDAQAAAGAFHDGRCARRAS